MVTDSRVLSCDTDLVFSVKHDIVYAQPSKPHIWKLTLSPLSSGDMWGYPGYPKGSRVGLGED